MVEIEENGEEDGKGDGYEDITDADFPEGNEPAAVYGREKSFAGW